MPTNTEMLTTIRTQALTRISELTENPKPSYQIDGQTVQWNDYLKQLRETVVWCDEQLAAEADETVEGLPEAFEVRSQAI